MARIIKKRHEIDMLHGTIGDKIISFAIPVAATAILQQLFNAADVAVVGRFVGPEAMAAVGTNSSVVGLLVGLFLGMSLGANVVIANAVGQHNPDMVHRAVHTSILGALIGGIIMAVIGELLAPAIMRMLNVTDEVMPMAVLYLRVYLAGLPVIFLYNFESAIFRGVGNTKTPLIALTISGIINVFGNLFFVIVVHMTVDGVALSTVLSNAISSIILLHELVHTDSDIRVRRKELRIDHLALRRIIHIGLPAGLQSMAFSLANIVIQAAVNSLGTIVMAASSAAFNIEIFAYDVENSFTQACTTFVGQNSGAGQYERCRKILKVCFIECIIAMAIMAFLILFFGRDLLAIFNTTPEVIETGYTRLLLIFTSYIFSMQYEMVSGYLRGFGISTLPAILTMIGVIGTRLFIIFAIFPNHRTFATIMAAYPISMAITAVLIYIAAAVYRPSRKREKAEAV